MTNSEQHIRAALGQETVRDLTSDSIALLGIDWEEAYWAVTELHREIDQGKVHPATSSLDISVALLTDEYLRARERERAPKMDLISVLERRVQRLQGEGRNGRASELARTISLLKAGLQDGTITIQDSEYDALAGRR